MSWTGARCITAGFVLGAACLAPLAVVAQGSGLSTAVNRSAEQQESPKAAFLDDTPRRHRSATLDRAALVALYNATDGPNWLYQTNWLSTEALSSWYGVTTGGDGRVTQLHLNDNRLSGEIPAALGNLTSLDSLDLCGNQLSGEIPAALGNLTNLLSLSLYENQFTGEIPAALGNLTRVAVLQLWNNRLSGEIPAALGNLEKVQLLTLYENQLSGGVPEELGDLATLRYLFLNDNPQLTGTIPDALEKLTQLETFDITNTGLCVKAGSRLATIDFRGSVCESGTQPPPTPPTPPTPQPPPPRGGGGGGGLLFPPRAPATLRALPGDRAMRLEWSPPENDGGSEIRRYEYRLKDGREQFGEWIPIPDSAPDEVNATGYTVMELGNGTVYVVELRAVNAAGNGRASEAVEVTMPLDPAWWSNFRAEDLEGVELGLDAFLLEQASRDRELRFGEGLRFEQDELDGEAEVTATHSGSYGYRYTSRTTGELSLEFDEGESCRLRLTFRGEGTGSYTYRCRGSSRGQGSFNMTELENRVPEITSPGPFEVEENRTKVGQLQAVDRDEQDEVTGYGIAGGVDAALFAVEAQTGALSFREAPDYESPADVESEEPKSEAGDNEYILVVEVTSGEGERERRREEAIRVRVADVEMEEAVEEELVEETEALFVPVILSAAGRNRSFFTSELTLTNRGSQEATLHHIYTAEAGGGSGTASEVLPAGRQEIRTNALAYLRDLGIPIPETGNQVGTLRVEAPPGSEVRAVVRTTTVVPDGRAGLAYPGVAEEEGFNEPVYLCGLRQNSRDRSNVAFQNMGSADEGAITLRTTVYSGEAPGTSPRELDDITLGPGGFHQFSGLLGSVENGYVKVERVEGEAPFYAYGVINDQANSDGSFVFPVAASSLEERGDRPCR